MIHRKQAKYDTFQCIADRCPKSCCIGWQIMIDEDSLAKYESHTGTFSDRLQSGIDYEEGLFHQHGTRCSMLNDNGLCDMQSTLGEGFLCDTCRLYPRHIEEFQDLREYSLSLSCPEAARMLLEEDYEFSLTESEDDTYDDPAEFEDFDFLIFDQLEYARDKMFALIDDRKVPFQERMTRIAATAYDLQECFDYGRILDMGPVADSILSGDYQKASRPHTGIELDYAYCMKSLDVLLKMEVLEDTWTGTIFETRKYWTEHADVSSEWLSAMHPDRSLEFAFEKVLKALLYTYFCGSVYDGEIYARAMIAVQSVRWLMMLYGAGTKELAPTLYLYSREVEHSDPNINSLISYFEKELEP